LKGLKMTYTFKLARRLAVSRHLAMLPVLLLFAACSGDSTAPDSKPTLPNDLAHFQVLPQAVTIETSQRVQFRARTGDSTDELIPTAVAWEATGGTIDSTGTFWASSPGTYRVVARRRWQASLAVDPARHGSRTQVDDRRDGRHGAALATDTSVVQVVSMSSRAAPIDRQLASAILTPARRTVAVGSNIQYRAYGRTKKGDSVSVAVAFSATGGKITSTGLFTAGSKPGTFQIMALDTLSGLADTTKVFVAAASTMGGASPSKPPVTPPNPSTPPVTLGKGIPFGAFAGQMGSVESAIGGVPFSLSMEPFNASEIVSRIKQAQASGMHLMIAMTSGKHDKYKSGGVFDMGKWRAKMDTYNTPAIRAAVAAAVADGTIIGNSVMDEPHNTYRGNGNSWGPRGTMTKARVDEMCGYVRQIFPTLPVGVVHDHNAFEPDKSYRVCDFIVSQYAWRKTKGDIQKFRDEALALGRRDGIAIAFSMNLLDGGIPGAESSGCSRSLTGGRGLMYAQTGSCEMTADQIRKWGETLGPAGCALLMWRYDPDFFSQPDNRQAFRDVTASLGRTPARSCRRS
jgi:hypothetical protein